MDSGSIADVATVVAVILGAFANGFWVSSQLGKRFKSQREGFQAQLDRTEKELKEQFQAQLLKAKAAWKDELARSLSAAKDEWLKEMEDLKGQQESTSTRLEQTETGVTRVKDALATLFQETANRMGESKGAYRRAAKQLTRNDADQPRDSDADSQ